MGGFKLIAIRLLKDTEFYLRNNLNHKEVYKFYSNYEFKFKGANSENEIESVVELVPDVLDLYSFESNERRVNVNISAIVGMNGSGKSSLFELFYAFCFILSRNEPNFIQMLNRYPGKKVYLERNIQNIENSLRIEVFFKSNELIYSLKFDGQDITQYTFEPKRKKCNKISMDSFCYSVVMNYSIYGLNEKQNPFFHLLFHKNDGYQAPIVINPMRTNGNIDVNKEFDLSQARLLLNLSNSTKEEIEIVKDKYLSSIEFILSPGQLYEVHSNEGTYKLQDVIDEHFRIHEENIYRTVNSIINLIYDEQNQLSPSEIQNFIHYDKMGLHHFIQYELVNLDKEQVHPFRIKYLLVRYIIKKIFKISFTYRRISDKYTSIEESFKKPQTIPSIKKDSLNEVMLYLVENKSHITFKLKQAIHILVNDTIGDILWSRLKYEPKNEEESIEQRMTNALREFYYKGSISLKDFKKKEYIKTKNEKYFLDVHTVPGAFIKPILSYTINGPLDSSTKKMSSGEQQFFQSINTITYHIRNIDSVEPSDIDGIKDYKNVNIILDEIELYFHPEYQRIFLFELLRNIRDLNLKNIQSINFIFSTHSPFILSDIPATNILRLENGTPSKKHLTQTFGSNIHDLLANDFFLRNGFMGEFAKGQINDVIEELQGVIEQKICILPNRKVEIERIIQIVGEPLLKNSLNNLFINAIPDRKNEFLQIQIDRLMALKNQ